MYTIRMAAPKDARELLDIYRPYVEQTAITFEYDVPSVEEFEKRIAKTLSRYPYYVLEEDGEIMGYAYVSAFKERAAYDWSVETSIYIRMDKKGKGYGKALYATLEDECRKRNIINFYACIATPADDQDPYLTMQSVQFHTHLGYRKCAEFKGCASKFDRWYDMVWMEKQLCQPAVPAKEVLFIDLTDDEKN